MKIKVYRIENEEGIGPFAKEYFDTTSCQNFYDHEFWPKLKKHFNQKHLPSLKEDNVSLNDEHLTGCLDTHDFNYWFTKDLLKALDSMNFAISCYEIDDNFVYVGKTHKQVVFDKNEMSLLGRIPLKNLYDAPHLSIKRNHELPKVYLAGPTVFFQNVHEVAEEMKDACKKLGFIPLFPMDTEIDIHSKDAPQQIANSNIALLQIADAVLADVSPFRGSSMDVGTAFEIGMAKQRNLPVVAYMNKKEPEYAKRVIASDTNTSMDKHNVLRDKDSNAIENFNLYENLMIASNTPLEIGFDKAILRLKKDFFPELKAEKTTKHKQKIKP
jgi:nucleoside 2-deoxyribosyltransferase